MLHTEDVPEDEDDDDVPRWDALRSWSTMTMRLLRLAARHPLKSLGFALLLPALPLATWLLLAKAPLTPTNPDLLQDRLWLDKFPEEPTDKFSLWLFIDDGYGFYRQGSGFRFQVDVVSYERKRDLLHITLLEDRKKKETRYTLRPCDEKPPFDLCLTFDNPPLGPAKFYGFSDSEQTTHRLPWLKVR
ncbi:MAG: hypothetical protein RMJ98_09890 [Myxococcales bacterium]|nr:hypothetical protein [Polyangiaceae bacterium]MDW8249600.1 hypothetical protein [Myxococcales bacterium]